MHAVASEVLHLYTTYGWGALRIARKLKITEYQAKRALRDARQAGEIPPRGPGNNISSVDEEVMADPGFSIEEIADEELDAQTLLARRKDEFARREKAWEDRELIGVKVTLDGPIGILHMGDPHVDDPGCNIAHLERDVQLVQATKGLFAANVGDLRNGWVGRLCHLWGKQETTDKQSWTLVEWLVGAVDWLYLLQGNHDMWTGSGDPVKWMLRQRKRAAIYEPHGARLNLTFPNGKQVRINARHDFKGHSQWNSVHGPAKAIQMGWRDHILTSGHLHISGMQVLKCPMTKLISYAYRVAGYKTHDDFGQKQLGLPNQNISPSIMTIIDPRYADDDPRLIHTCFDAEQGADYLTWLRKRKS